MVIFSGSGDTGTASFAALGGEQIGMVALRHVGMRAQAALQGVLADIAEERVVRVAASRPWPRAFRCGGEVEQRDFRVEWRPEEEGTDSRSVPGRRRDDAVHRGLQIAVRGHSRISPILTTKVPATGSASIQRHRRLPPAAPSASPAEAASGSRYPCARRRPARFRSRRGPDSE